MNGSYVLDKETPVFWHYSFEVSGICRFVEGHEDLDELDSPAENKVNKRMQLKRFIILNYHGICNLNLIMMGLFLST